MTLTAAINLTADQRETLKEVLKGNKKISASYNRVNALELTAENVLELRQAVLDHFNTRFSQKTRTAQGMRTCLDCERIIDKIDDRLHLFGIEAPEEVDDDSAIAIPTLKDSREAIVNKVAEKGEGEEDA